MGTLTGKTILITGAGRGQGRAHAIAAAEAGADIVAIDVCSPVDGVEYDLASPEDLQRTVELVESLDRRIVSTVADVRDSEAISSAVNKGISTFGAIDGVVANAAVLDWGPKLWEISEEMWTTVIDINLSGVWRTVKAVAPHMIAARSGSIVMISSINGFEAAFDYTSYVAAKHGVIGLMRNAALELAPHNVRSNAVCPGAIDTKIWNNPMGYAQFNPGQAATREDAVDACYAYPALAGRTALPSRAVSNAVCWLLSDLAEHVTGIALPVDGGHLVQPGWNMDPQRTGAEAERYRPPATTP